MQKPAGLVTNNICVASRHRKQRCDDIGENMSHVALGNFWRNKQNNLKLVIFFSSKLSLKKKLKMIHPGSNYLRNLKMAL